MRTHHLTKIFNSILILFALMLFAVCYQKLNTDQNGRVHLQNIIGSILERKNVVQLKHPNEIAWKFISSEAKNPLINNDAIFTHTDSEANISLNQGQELTIQSQSLVRIKTAQEINLKDGKVAIKVKEGQKPLKLIIDNTTYELSAKTNSIVQIEKKFKSSLFKVESGQVDLTTPQEKISLNTGMSTSITPNDIKTKSNQFSLLAPQGVVLLEQGQNLSFEFKSEQKVFEIHIKRDDKYFKISPTESINLKPEAYQWGIITESNTTPLIWENFILLKNMPAPTPTSPQANTILPLSQLNSNQVIQWNSQLPTQVEILDHNKYLLHSFVTNQSHASLPSLAAGKYFYQLRVNHNFYRSPYSTAIPFYIHDLDNQTEIQKIEIAKPDQLIEFELNEAPEAQSLLVISKNSDLSSPRLKKKVTSSKVQFHVKDTGIYYWKLENNTQGIQFKKILIVPTPAPVKAPKVKDIIKKLPQSSWFKKILSFFISSAHASSDTQILIEWQKIEEAKNYEIEIYLNKKDRKPLLKEVTKTPFLKWKAPKSETYFYRVRYQDHWDRYSPFSNFAVITFQVQDQSPPPQTKQLVSETKNINNVIDQYQISIYYSLSQISQTQQLNNSTDAKIEGTNSTGHALQFKKKSDLFSKDDSISLFYQSRYGEVFDGEKFSQRYLDLAWHNATPHFDYSLGMSGYQFSQYALEGEKVVQANNPSGLNLLFNIAKPINWGKNQKIKPFMTIKALSAYQFLAGISYENHLFSQSFLSLKLSYEINRFNSEDLEHNSSLIQLLTGITQKY